MIAPDVASADIMQFCGTSEAVSFQGDGAVRGMHGDLDQRAVFYSLNYNFLY
jgi:hypothetical protein